MVSRLHSDPKETTWSTPWSLWRVWKGAIYCLKKTAIFFFWISDDQTHEQNNEVIKGSGGAIGIFHFPISLAKLMIAESEIARRLSSFDGTLND